MKKLYWRPPKISRRVLLLIALVAAAGVISTEIFKIEEPQPLYKEKIKASRLARRSFEAIRDDRTRAGVPIDRESDPSGSGLIGDLLTSVTTNPGHLPAKQTSVNPNFAGVLVHLLYRAGVEEGDHVAVGLSGSFPAMNICVYSAVQAIGAQPVVISSVGASQWGANTPRFMWPHMEEVLKRRGIFPRISRAYSLGGINDRALGLSREGKGIMKQAIEESDVPFLEVADYADSVEKRMQIYAEASEDGDYAAYVNVGGGTSSVGTRVGKKMFRPGLNRYAPAGVTELDSVMARFAYRGTPVIHITGIDNLAVKYGLPLQPTALPKVGVGSVFRKEVYQEWIALLALAAIIGLSISFIRMDWGQRIMLSWRRSKKDGKPEQMV